MRASRPFKLPGEVSFTTFYRGGITKALQGLAEIGNIPVEIQARVRAVFPVMPFAFGSQCAVWIDDAQLFYAPILILLAGLQLQAAQLLFAHFKVFGHDV